MSKQSLEKINWLTAQFASEESEAAFQAFVFRRNLKNNVWGTLVGLALFTLYAFSDFIDATNPEEMVTIRLVTFVLALSIMSLLLTKRFVKHHDQITAIVTILVASAMNLIIWRQPMLDNTYYIGLIQGFILFGLLLRLSFISMMTAAAACLAGFALATFTKPDIAAAALQFANLSGVAIICVVGVYLLQGYQRSDFLKALTIENQNQQLSVLLDDVRRDHERKLAAMNMLVHFVKTPLHQINGFSEILMSNLAGEEKTESDDSCVESARYIKDATTNLSNSVNRLLTYHRLDEIERQNEFDNVSIDEQLHDFSDMLDGDITVKIEGSSGSVNTIPVALKTLFESLATYYNEKASEAPSIEVALSTEGNAEVCVIIRDDSEVVVHEEFLENTKPLTKIDNYLTSAGSEMPMLLRTVARAVELVGGRFDHEPLADGNVFKIRFSNDRFASSGQALSGLQADHAA
jgi:signal transduction histidine kinase